LLSDFTNLDMSKKNVTLFTQVQISKIGKQNLSNNQTILKKERSSP